MTAMIARDPLDDLSGAQVTLIAIVGIVSYAAYRITALFRSRSRCRDDDEGGE